MDTKTAAIILCAGLGSRIGLPPHRNKCAVSVGGTTPVAHCASALLRAGADRITVVVGHASRSVREALAEYCPSGQVEFVENPWYNRHGCNYSLALGMGGRFPSRADRVMIAEGDSILNGSSFLQLAGTAAQSASLVRDKGYVDFTRSVVAVGEKGKIRRYEYDAGHTGRPPACREGESVVGDSMQLWAFSGPQLHRLRELLGEYRRRAQGSRTPLMHSGVYSINRMDTEIEPVFADYPDDWINLNTQEDLRKAGEATWLIK